MHELVGRRSGLITEHIAGAVQMCFCKVTITRYLFLRSVNNLRSCLEDEGVTTMRKRVLQDPKEPNPCVKIVSLKCQFENLAKRILALSFSNMPEPSDQKIELIQSMAK